MSTADAPHYHRAMLLTKHGRILATRPGESSPTRGYTETTNTAGVAVRRAGKMAKTLATPTGFEPVLSG